MIDNNGRQKGFLVSASPKSVLCFLSCRTKKGRLPAGTGSLIMKQPRITGLSKADNLNYGLLSD